MFIENEEDLSPIKLKFYNTYLFSSRHVRSSQYTRRERKKSFNEKWSKIHIIPVRRMLMRDAFYLTN
jgi:hypothetical protein